ncbi:hypothetical protein CVT26_006097 [Gymnopilus dilepis]|uniref:SET domain-containing protein n=1 Tax=Gymnopilus dilepis TaxID=231916 RepID=A0A409YKJ8_9AGAR|nr:hypothetical protein CVT26_006097 [Gymnopilus dilepis]
MDRNTSNSSSAPPRRQQPWSPATASEEEMAFFAKQERTDDLAWTIYREAQRPGGPEFLSDEFFHNVFNNIYGGNPPMSTEKMNELAKGARERVMNKRGTKGKSPSTSGSTVRGSSGSQSTTAVSEALRSVHLETEYVTDARKLDHDDSTILITTIPSPPDGFDKDPDGHCQWVVRGPTRAKVINTPGYPSPVPKPEENKVTIMQTQAITQRNMGLGVVATKDIQMGELIFAERPMLMTPRAVVRLASQGGPKSRDKKSSLRMALIEWEKLLQEAVDRMEPLDRSLVLRLPNSHRNDGSGMILGAVRTNGFAVEEIFDGPEKKSDESNIYAALLRYGSMINHNCVPNIRYEFSVASVSFQFYAMVDIKAGQELFYSFCETNVSAAERRKKLAPYGITCHCDACEHATKQTDKLRQEYQSKTSRLLRALNWQRREGKKVAQTAIDPIIKLKDALAKEGLGYTHEYKCIVVILAQVLEELGKDDLAKEYKEEGEKYNVSKEKLVKYSF